MAIKTIFAGNPKKPEVWKGKCPRCGSVHEAEQTDLRDVRPDDHGLRGVAVCPVCTGVSQLITVEFRPKPDYDRLKKAEGAS